MNSGTMQDFLKGKTILVTGTTGFLAKVFVEKILRIQPDIQKLYLLIRASNTELASHRMQNEVFQTDLFRVLRDKLGGGFNSFISKKVVAVAGDAAVENLGIKDNTILNVMFEEIDLIVHSAGTTNFNERFDISMGVNTMGALHVLNVAKKCRKINVLVHISTAYVCGETKEGKPIFQEKPFEMGRQSLERTLKLDIHTEMNLLEKKLDELRAMNVDEKTIKHALKDYGIERANLHGWPNTYVFTKAMGEMLLVHHKDNVPLIIIRPTMVTSTSKDPFPGWIEGQRTVDSMICAYGKGKLPYFLGNPRTILDIMPADLVINCVIAAIVINLNKAPKNFIYHVSSSLRNPLKISDVHNISHQYFKKTPCLDEDGKPIVISKGIALKSMAAFNIYTETRYVLPLEVLNLVNKLICHSFQDVYDDNYKKIRIVKRLAKLYKPYVFFKAVFDDTNTENLRRETMSYNMENGMLEFDPISINWTNYMMNTHIPGLVKYAMK
ncbi:putative alcohol-forming fatty acyl-CoA reductase [Medicago truncatula]|uniref:Fatty acyl-CoA reductase n=1 Tax=Medicago truncatula TaxID=3880 RepID=G7JJM2_MEDTR|nr:probable fatty acyl-CoA reductase 4 [Medicago truncatula]AES88362.2 gland-specific fatty acyl-CoA reductase [Medicago truncatula]RHN60519.1 putative alcohol-forming fatty acyl-CoA reductase [Medicago truncatula]